MLFHPDLMLDQFYLTQRERIAAAERHRLLAAARRRHVEEDEGQTRARHAARGRPEATLAPCGPRAAVPAR